MVPQPPPFGLFRRHLLWKESHSTGLLYQMKLHQPLHITVISKLGQEAGV